jgi:hypothetical protein
MQIRKLGILVDKNNQLIEEDVVEESRIAPEILQRYLELGVAEVVTNDKSDGANESSKPKYPKQRK